MFVLSTVTWWASCWSSRSGCHGCRSSSCACTSTGAACASPYPTCTSPSSGWACSTLCGRQWCYWRWVHSSASCCASSAWPSAAVRRAASTWNWSAWTRTTEATGSPCVPPSGTGSLTLSDSTTWLPSRPASLGPPRSPRRRKAPLPTLPALPVPMTSEKPIYDHSDL